MGPRAAALRVLVLHNDDFRRLAPDDPRFASLADVENAARGVAAALESRGHRAEILAVDGDTVGALLARLQPPGERPDVVFNLCESLGCDSRHEGFVPSLLELVGVPYTGSSAFAIGLALRKDRAKEVMRARGIPTPEAIAVLDEGELAARPIGLPFPLIVKPTHEDASVGIEPTSVVRSRPELERAALRVLRELRQPALVERFIDGRELYVSLLGNRPPRVFPFHEIDFTGLPEGLPRIVSYAGKWDTGSVEFAFTRPTRCILDDATRDRVERAARAAFEALGLADYGRIDLRLDGAGRPYVIDVNPNCDLSDGAGFSRAASYAGLDYPALIERVCLVAMERHAHEHGHVLLSAAAERAGEPIHAVDAPPAPARARGAARERRSPVHIAGTEGLARADRRRYR